MNILRAQLLIVQYAVMFERMGWAVDRLCPSFVVDNPKGNTSHTSFDVIRLDLVFVSITG